LLFGVGVLSAIAAAAVLWTSAERVRAADDANSSQALTMVVMDPLAKPLSCPCVQGYAQRDYDQLASRLEKDLGRPVRVVYNDSLTTALKRDTKGQADLVIGKHSVVLFDAKRSQLALAPVAKLADKQGETTMRGLVVVPMDDPAKSVADLAGYRLVFGPEECDEKHAAAIALFKKGGITLPEKLETSAACSDGACSVLENAKTQRGAAVISSYARPLLEGCGTVPKGSLRLVGETEPVPFIEAFVNQRLPLADSDALTFALIKATNDPILRIALETRDGFKPIEAKEVEVAKKK
jgi:ABC-type phosphate/phosphonate transport system substrate-binding protein